MCTGINSIGQPNITGRIDRPTMGTCTVTTKTMALRRIHMAQVDDGFGRALGGDHRRFPVRRLPHA